jgi:hypothetical protein
MNFVKWQIVYVTCISMCYEEPDKMCVIPPPILTSQEFEKLFKDIFDLKKFCLASQSSRIKEKIIIIAKLKTKNAFYHVFRLLFRMIITCITSTLNVIKFIKKCYILYVIKIVFIWTISTTIRLISLFAHIFPQFF